MERGDQLPRLWLREGPEAIRRTKRANLASGFIRWPGCVEGCAGNSETVRSIQSRGHDHSSSMTVSLKESFYVYLPHGICWRRYCRDGSNSQGAGLNGDQICSPI